MRSGRAASDPLHGNGKLALLIRPDGHVAWAAAPGGTPDISALRTALTTWFGPAR
ncbi:hypothetical protein [Streptomyces fodineus]|uniref:aromatic-ring hydroxylase C-terminal domain-containing protein n=1 Tax=Streptomyces fodineus TaxID=1904616 RepID=UPI001D03B0CB|nr:hypothetical protein [Streptomyces fodineus]